MAYMWIGHVWVESATAVSIQFFLYCGRLQNVLFHSIQKEEEKFDKITYFLDIFVLFSIASYCKVNIEM